MKNIVLFLSAACLLSAPIFGQQQENRFAEITDPQLLSINKLPPHASFTSYVDETSALNKDKANGSFYLPLNGTWKFHYTEKFKERPMNFMEPDFNSADWKEIKVNNKKRHDDIAIFRDAAGKVFLYWPYLCKCRV